MEKLRTAQLRHAEYYESILQEADELFTRGGNDSERGLELFDLNRANIVAAQAWSEKYARDDEAVARVCNDFGTDGPFVLDLRQSSRENIRWFEAALTISQRLGEKSDEGMMLGNLGWTYSRQGEIERAIELYQQQMNVAVE